jgi:hypothetical protein
MRSTPAPELSGSVRQYVIWDRDIGISDSTVSQNSICETVEPELKMLDVADHSIFGLEHLELVEV